MLRALLLVLLMSWPAFAQWQILDTHSTADFRGVSSVGKGVVWISGTNGTVLRSEDAGYLWQHCTTPAGAEHLDFRGIQAFDANTAIVMSSGKGDLSRLYKTTDGCQTWKLVLRNSSGEGFFDSFAASSSDNVWLLGDPVEGSFFVGETDQHGANSLDRSWAPDWKTTSAYVDLRAHGRSAFAASNSSLILNPNHISAFRPEEISKGGCKLNVLWFGTSGPDGAKIFRLVENFPKCSSYAIEQWRSSDIPLAGKSASSGVFSMAARSDMLLVAVGGDYKAPNESNGTAVYSADGGEHWSASEALPRGYRSAVAFDESTQRWITVGPNGTDVSSDDGRNWRALKPIAGDAVDADRDWNALSLPYVVGPHGRVGMLEPAAFK